MAKWIREHRPAIWIHHHHFMENFRSPQYDVEKARAVGLTPLPEIVSSLKNSGCRGVIFSGSYFEPGEGGQSLDAPVTPYSQSKRWVWEKLTELCQPQSLPLSKVVIPNPIGPFENDDRLIPIMIRNARTRETLTLSSPEALGDNLSVFDLADQYVRVAKEMLEGKGAIVRPSGWVATTRDFVAGINEALVEKELGLTACPVVEKVPAALGKSYLNSASEKMPFSLSEFAREYARALRV